MTCLMLLTKFVTQFLPCSLIPKICCMNYLPQPSYVLFLSVVLEIRAENLSGECHWLREMQNGRLVTDFSGHGAKCVKRRAELSVKANHNCADKAAEYVDAAFERCYKDTFPFDRHPNLR